MAFANTDLSVVGILTYHKKSLLESNDVPLPTSISISNDTVDKYLIPCQVIDNLILPQIDLINQKKQEIVNICKQASGVGLANTCPVSSTANAVNTTYEKVITGLGTTAIGTNIGFGITTGVGFGTIREDTLQAYIYPNIENKIYTTDNPLEGEGYIRITSSNVGIGKETSLFMNDSDGDFIGLVVNLSGGNQTCAGYADSIDQLIQEIDDIRAGIANTINASTIIKGYKTKEQLNHWTLNRIKQIHINDVDAINIAVSILENPIYGGPY